MVTNLLHKLVDLFQLLLHYKSRSSSPERRSPVQSFVLFFLSLFHTHSFLRSVVGMSRAREQCVVRVVDTSAGSSYISHLPILLFRLVIFRLLDCLLCVQLTIERVVSGEIFRKLPSLALLLAFRRLHLMRELNKALGSQGRKVFHSS
jgi:hypothetical protein